MKKRIIGASLVLAMQGICVVAQGQTSQADILFKQAVQEAERGDFAAACPHFEESYKLNRKPGTSFSHATCLKSEGKLASAFTRYHQFINDFADLDTDKRSQFKNYRQAALEALRDLEDRVPRLKLRLLTGAPQGLVVSLDGVILYDWELHAERTVDPGTHKIAADAPGRKRLEWEVVLQEGQTLDVPIRIPVGPASAPRPSVPVKPKAIAMPTATPTNWTGREVVMAASGSIALVGLVTWGVPGIFFLSTKSEVDAHCVNNVCNTVASTQTARDAQTYLHYATVGAIVGCSGAVAFIVSALAGVKSKTPKPRIEAGVWRVDATGATFGVKGAF